MFVGHLCNCCLSRRKKKFGFKYDVYILFSLIKKWDFVDLNLDHDGGSIKKCLIFLWLFIWMVDLIHGISVEVRQRDKVSFKVLKLRVKL